MANYVLHTNILYYFANRKKKKKKYYLSGRVVKIQCLVIIITEHVVDTKLYKKCKSNNNKDSSFLYQRSF